MRRGLKYEFCTTVCYLAWHAIRRFPDEEGTEIGRASAAEYQER